MEVVFIWVWKLNLEFRRERGLEIYIWELFEDR